MGARIYNPYDPPPVPPEAEPGKSMTKQADKDACDINFIMRRYEKTGELPEGAEGFFAELAPVGSFQELQNALVYGKRVFDQLTAEDKAKFGNDVSVFLDFASDKANKDTVAGMLSPGSEGPPAPAPEPPALTAASAAGEAPKGP